MFSSRRAKVQSVDVVYTALTSNESRCTHNDLLVRGDELQGLLDDPAAVHLQGQRQDMTSDPLCQSQLLVQASKLENTHSTESVIHQSDIDAQDRHPL